MTEKTSIVLGIPVMAACFLSSNILYAQQITPHESAPKILSMLIGKKDYSDPAYQQDIARSDIAILGFYQGQKGRNGESINDMANQIKRYNPDILLGQYTVLSEAQDDTPATATRERGRKIDEESWWLRNAAGDRVQWIDKYDTWEVNITEWATPDSDGKRYPEWLAWKDYSAFFRNAPALDIWYLDNALRRPAVKVADWDLDGVDDFRDDLDIRMAYRRGQVAHWNAAQSFSPNTFRVGNSNDVPSSEYSGKLHGVFMEAIIGASWSLESWNGWDAVMARYRLTFQHTASPHIVGFDVRGRKDDYQRMRYGLTSCLLNDGYFSYTDETSQFTSVVWFDEYDLELGKPIDSPPTQPWQNGVYRRRYQQGMVLTNPTDQPKTVTIENGYQRFKGTQAPDVNTGASVTSLTLASKDGIILLKSTEDKMAPQPPRGLQVVIE